MLTRNTFKFTGLPALFYTGSWMVLCGYTQFRWAFEHDFYRDFGWRLLGAGVVGVLCACLFFVVWRALAYYSIWPYRDNKFVRGLAYRHAVFYLLLLYPFHLTFGLSRFWLDRSLAAVTLAVYLLILFLRLFAAIRHGRPFYNDRRWWYGIGSLYWRYLKMDLARVRGWAARRGQGGYCGLYTFTWLLAGVHLLLFFLVFRYPVYSAAGLLATLTVSLAGLALWVHLAKLLSFGKRTGAALTTWLLAVLYVVLYGYHYMTRVPFDLELLTTNFSLLASREAWQMLGSFFTPWHFAGLGLVAGGLVLLEWKFRVFSQRPTAVKAPHVAITLALLAALVAVPVPTTDETTLLARTIARHFSGPANGRSATAARPYPYVNDSSFISLPGRCAEKPNVFIIFLESLGGRQIGHRLADGREVTPVFNALVPQGVYVEQFYGNSVQTSKGQFATLTGTWPAVRHKIFTTYPDLNLMPLPRILRDHGYYTLFIKAYHDLGFDNTGNFARHLGYHEVLAMDERFVTPAERRAVWGWGIEDSLFYRKVFGHLDTCRGRAGQEPLFVTLTTVTNHMMFNRTPAEKKILFPGSEAPEHNYLNTVHLADKFLQEFLDQLHQRAYLANSLVVLVGDHGFPSGEHGFYHNEISFYEEFFRTPLLVLWPGKLEPQVVAGRAYSQVDIAPTVLDLLEISAANHFTGHSLFAHRQTDNTVLLIQPYSGMYLAAVRWPYKYVRGIAANTEYLFDLAADPAEEHNLFGAAGLAGITAELEKGVDRLMDHDALVRTDRMWPAGAAIAGNKTPPVGRRTCFPKTTREQRQRGQ